MTPISPSFTEHTVSLLTAAQERIKVLEGALQDVLPFIDDADDAQQFYPESAATNACRAAVARVRAALKSPVTLAVQAEQHRAIVRKGMEP